MLLFYLFQVYLEIWIEDLKPVHLHTRTHARTESEQHVDVH